jgi:peptidoglycan/xylan/chitin deacetylase (PgdA/CDA1 family)
MDKPAFISLTFDDGLRCQFEQAVPILDRHRFPATFFLVANTDPIFTDGFAEQKGFNWRKIAWNADDIKLLKGLVERGHEIGSHTVSHKGPRIMAGPAIEASESKKLIEQWMETEIPSFCYPFYWTIQHLKQPVMKAGYRQARTGPQQSYYASPDSVDWFAVDCRQIMRTGVIVSTWVKPGCWHVLTFHGSGGDQDGWEPVTETEFARQMAELAELRESGAVEVVTFKDGADRLRRRISDEWNQTQLTRAPKLNEGSQFAAGFMVD